MLAIATKATLSAPVPEELPNTLSVDYQAVHARAIFRLLPLALRLKREIQQFRPDFLWVPTYRGYGLPSLLCGRSANVPYGIYFHGTEIQTEVKRSARKYVLERVLRSAGLICTNSRNTAHLLQKYFPYVKPEPITPGVDPNRFDDPENRAKARQLRHLWIQQSRNAGEQLTILLSMCRLAKGKGLHLVIDALAELQADKPDLNWLYIIAGDGTEREALREQVAGFELQDRILFVGAVLYRDAPQYYCAADIYVQPSQPDGSFLESFGISFLEAQAAGLPCIGSDWGGVPEAVEAGKSAILIPVADTSAIRRAIQALISDADLRMRYAQYARTVAARNTWREHAQKLSVAIHRTPEAEGAQL